jgi:3',5'-cyclic AMP phosphodiesterase CpdA
MPTFRFAIISDPHVALPHTIEPIAQRFHLVEVSLAALNQALAHLEQIDLDFLLIPGDLTQDGEPDNHRWLSERLARLPFPAYVIPGNHDVTVPQSTPQAVGLDTFARYYPHCGYDQAGALYYRQALLPGVQLIGLNSNGFNDSGEQVGRLDETQLQWLVTQLQQCAGEFVIVMIHHNVIEHLPGQSTHNLGCRYMLDNAPALLQILQQYQVKLILTGHLHVQDIAHQDGIYEITTGSLVSYPHPYRVIEADLTPETWQLAVTSYRVDAVDGYPDLAQTSRQFLGDRSARFMSRLLTSPPLNVAPEATEPLLESLRYFWADVAAGDGEFDFPHFPSPVRAFLQQFSSFNHPPHLTFTDNDTVLKL